MGLFSKILTKLGLKKKSEEPKSGSSTTRAAPKQQRSTRAAPDWSKERAHRSKMEVVDVVSQLEELAAKTSQDLNWKTSIVDLLKLLDLDSSYEARKELAVELDCPSDKLDDSAAMNIWLHKTVLQKIADNGGNIPRDLLD